MICLLAKYEPNRITITITDGEISIEWEDSDKGMTWMFGDLINEENLSDDTVFHNTLNDIIEMIKTEIQKRYLKYKQFLTIELIKSIQKRER